MVGIKKFFILFFCIFSLSGCLTSMDKQLTESNKKSDTPIINTLEMYEDFIDKFYLKFIEDDSDYYYITSSYSDLMIKEIKYECINRYTSDECIRYRHEHPSLYTKHVYFNYKKYLPSEYNISSDEDFLKLIDFYRKSYKKGYIKCDSNGQCELKSIENFDCKNLTNYECDLKKQEYGTNFIKNLESELQWYIKDGMRETEEVEIKRIAAEKAAKEAAEKAVLEKEKAYKNCVENVKKKINRCGDTYKIGCRETISYDVISITDEGVLVHNPYSGDTKFLYTNKNYTTGSTPPSANYLKSGIYHEYVGTYDYISVLGTHERVHAFKEVELSLPNCEDYKK